ncbi:hypothetical protein SETIT_7G072900v2 [Setaria italica]|uniref:Beta-amylase n=1 Tax=Setaria italica TaxID=4555 RepID=K3YFG2_SETIT|nr:hypothetical protein SETIT_7G072900v2 [Setaria italica]
MEAASKGLVVEEEDTVRLFVGLPADVVVSDSRGVCRPRAVSAALRALKLLGVDGVELPVSWAAVQPGPGGWFEWAGYRAVAAMVCDAGLGPASRSPPTATRSLSGWPTPRPPTPTSSSPTGPGTAARCASPSPSTSSRCSSASRRSRPTRPSSAALTTSSTTSWSQPLRM